MEEPKQPRIILHTPEPTDGAALYVSQLAAALAGETVPVVLFCPSNFEYETMAREAGVEVVHSAFREVNPAGWLRRFARNLVFAVRSVEAQRRLVAPGDVVHFHNPLHLPMGLVFLVLAKWQRASVVLTAHDPLPHRARLPQALQGLERAMLASLYRLSDCVIVHNNGGKRILIDTFQKPSARVAVIPHGPYAPFENQRTPYPASDCQRLLAFGAIRQNKGLNLAIEAVQKVNEPSSVPVRLTIAGRVDSAAEQSYWDYCQRLIAKKPECIEVCEGYVADADVAPLLARHHAMLLPYSDFYSESGVAALALSHRRPIIASRSGGLEELLQQSDCGIVVESPTAEAVAEAIASAISVGAGRLQQMGIEGWQFLHQDRSWAAIARQTRQVYSDLMENTIDAWDDRCLETSAAGR